VLYARCVDLLDDLHAGHADGTYALRRRLWVDPFSALAQIHPGGVTAAG